MAKFSIGGLFSSKQNEPVRQSFVPRIYIQKKQNEILNEQFKSEGTISLKQHMNSLLKVDKNIKPHPFDIQRNIKLYEQFGPVTGVVDKYNDYILGPGFYVRSEDERASTLINEHIIEYSLYNVMNEVIRLGLPGGTIGVEMKKTNNIPSGYKIIPPHTFYLKEDTKGEITGYAQIPENKLYDEAIPFELDEVAVFTFNKVGNYGLGIVQPALSSINNIMQSSKDLHTLQSRKSNAPIWAKLGGEVAGELIEPCDADITNFGKEFEYINNKTEFTTGPLVDLKVIDFGNVGEKFGFILDYDWKEFYTTVQVPQVLLGEGSVPEGLAKVQMDGFQRRIKSFQEELEKVMEQQIFSVILEAHGIDAKVEVVWGLPSEFEKKEQLSVFSELLKNPLLSFELRDELEKKIADILEINLVKETPEKERSREETEKKQPIVPGSQNQPQQQVKKKEHVCEHKGCTCHEHYDLNEELKEDYSLQEWLGWNYQEYKDEIDKAIQSDNFDDVIAKTETQLAAGKLSEVQIVALKRVLRDGIANDLTMKEIANEIQKKVKPKTLWKVDDEGKLVKKDGKRVLQLSAKYRPMMIARTEVIRVSNEGAKNQYKKMGAEKVKWVSTVSERTCPECESLYGTIYPINEALVPPLHPMCRCTLTPVVNE